MVDEDVYGVPEALPMTALFMMAVGMSWAYQSGVWGLWDDGKLRAGRRCPGGHLRGQVGDLGR